MYLNDNDMEIEESDADAIALYLPSDEDEEQPKRIFVENDVMARELIQKDKCNCIVVEVSICQVGSIPERISQKNAQSKIHREMIEAKFPNCNQCNVITLQ